MAKTLIYLEPGGTSLHVRLYQTLFASWLPPHPASLGFAIAWILGWLAVLWRMDRLGLRIKV